MRYVLIRGIAHPVSFVSWLCRQHAVAAQSCLQHASALPSTAPAVVVNVVGVVASIGVYIYVCVCVGGGVGELNGATRGLSDERSLGPRGTSAGSSSWNMNVRQVVWDSSAVSLQQFTLSFRLAKLSAPSHHVTPAAYQCAGCRGVSSRTPRNAIRSARASQAATETTVPRHRTL